MLRLPLSLLPVLLVTATGCDAAATDLVAISLSDTSSVQIDSSCSGDCIDEVTLQVTFEEDIAVDLSSQISIEQYRVDYTLSDVQLTYFADTTSLRVTSGQVGYVDIMPASWEQQEEVVDAVGDAYVSGTATLTAAGYDWRDEVFTVSTDFAISFEDIEDQ